MMQIVRKITMTKKIFFHNLMKLIIKDKKEQFRGNNE